MESLKDQCVRLVGIILAGGESRRFGSPKALARLKGQYFIEYAIQSLEGFTMENVIISHSTITSELKKVTSLPVIEDVPEFKGKGPLAGLATGMNYLQSDWYIILPCDTPTMTKAVITSLVEHINEDVDAIIPVVNGRIQPLIGLYHSRVLDKVNKLLESDQYKMMKLLDQVKVKSIDFEDDKPFQNINNLEEFKKID